MSKKLVIATVIGLALATSACSELKGMVSSQSDGGTYMGGSAPVAQDPAGSATVGTGSTAYTGYDTRNDFAAGVGIGQ